MFDNELYGMCEDEPLTSRIEATINGIPYNIKLESDVIPVIEQFSFYKSHPKESSLGKRKSPEKKTGLQFLPKNDCYVSNKVILKQVKESSTPTR